MRVLVVEPYHGGSHQAWADGLLRHSRHQLTLVTHEDRFWRWRLRGSSLTLAQLIEAEIADSGAPDLLLVSGMVDLAALLGFARRSLPASTPVVLYQHESQLVHPVGPRQRPDDTNPAYANWLSMAVADAVVFNSAFHRDAVLDALPSFLDEAPDHRHTFRVDAMRDRSTVLPVGVELDRLLVERPPPDGGPPLIVWNQRWDHDKAPARLLAVLRRLADQPVPFRVALAGEDGRSDPQEFDAAIEALGDRVVHVGFLERSAYIDLLLRSDVVVSTAEHEFFGVAVVEAMAAGCVPLLPDRLSYPELVPLPWHEPCLYRSGLFDRLRAVLEDIDAARRRTDGLREAMAPYSWDVVGARYDAAFDELVRR